MTPLTLVLALTNPVSDCGCFGDAIVLTNWQTFGKNVALLLMAVVTLANSRRIWRIISERSQWLIFVYALGSVVGFMIYNMRHLPVVDFRPYSIGTNIVEAMTVPEDAPQDEYETYFVVEKDGQQRTVTADEYVDSTWTFVSRQSRLVSRGYVPPITDLHLTSLDGDDMTWEVLEQPGYTFLLVAHDLERTNEGMLDVINDLYDYAKVEDCSFYMLTSSNLAAIDEWNRHTGAAYPYLNVDETLLKTMVRTNLGLIVLKDATVVGKWSGADLPSDEQQYTAMEHNGALSITPHEVTARRISVALWMFLPFLLLCLADRLWGDE
jgi:triosephosphate isomerase